MNPGWTATRKARGIGALDGERSGAIMTWWPGQQQAQCGWAGGIDPDEPPSSAQRPARQSAGEQARAESPTPAATSASKGRTTMNKSRRIITTGIIVDRGAGVQDRGVVSG